METGLLVVVVVLGALLVVVSWLMYGVVKELRKAVAGLERRIERLQDDLSAQEQNLQALRAVLASKPDDPFQAVLDTVGHFRSKGWLAATAMVGFRLFRSYLNGRGRRKALPSLDKQRSER